MIFHTKGTVIKIVKTTVITQPDGTVTRTVETRTTGPEDVDIDVDGVTDAMEESSREMGNLLSNIGEELRRGMERIMSPFDRLFKSKPPKDKP